MSASVVLVQSAASTSPATVTAAALFGVPAVKAPAFPAGVLVKVATGLFSGSVPSASLTSTFISGSTLSSLVKVMRVPVLLASASNLAPLTVKLVES